jgi:hypothetical protein
MAVQPNQGSTQPMTETTKNKPLMFFHGTGSMMPIWATQQVSAVSTEKQSKK